MCNNNIKQLIRQAFSGHTVVDDHRLTHHLGRVVGVGELGRKEQAEVV